MTKNVPRVAAMVLHASFVLVVTGITAPAQDLQLQHRPVQCWASDQFTTVSYDVESAAEVLSVKVYYRAAPHRWFYFVEQVPTGSSGGFAMPKPSVETTEVVYFLEAVSSVYESSRTPIRTVPVLPAEECRRRDPDAAWFDGDDPGIAIRAISSGAPKVPPGFQSAGLATGRNVPVAAFIAGAGAAGGAFIFLGGDSSPGSNDPNDPGGGNSGPSGDPGPGTGSTPPDTSSPATTTVPASSPPTTSVPATSTTSVEPLADLAVSIFDSVDPVPVGTVVTYNIVVVNNGPQTATGVRLTVTFPTSVTLVSSSGAPCSGLVGTRVTCELSSMSPGTSKNVQLVVAPTTPGTFSARAEASGNQRDPVPSNNSASESTTVTLTSKVVQDVQIALQTEIASSSARGEMRTEGRSFSITSGAPLNLRFDAAGGESLIEASFSSTEEGTWRFDFRNSEAVVAGSIIVEAGEPIVHDSKLVVFKISEDGRIRFRYRITP